MPTLNAETLTLNDVHRLLMLQKLPLGSFVSLLALEALTQFEQQEIQEIQEDFSNYLADGKVLEGEVKLLVLAPILRLAGFYKSPLKIILEENIGTINVVDEDTNIKGRYDLLAINQSRLNSEKTVFWVLVVESKNSEIETLTGLPQLLTYAYKSLEYQSSVWGLTTNGSRFQFVYLQQGNPPTYQLMPSLTLLEPEPSIQILQVFKAICKLEIEP